MIRVFKNRLINIAINTMNLIAFGAQPVDQAPAQKTVGARHNRRLQYFSLLCKTY
jgi:hypothetical protein